MVRSALTGILSIYNKAEGDAFTDDDQRLLSIIAAQSAQIIENARLFESQKEMIRIQEELDVAGRIQKNLLPHSAPEVDGYDIAGVNQPARSVGGDYYDFIPVDRDRIGICLADVSGKGVPASLLMANIQATMRSQLLVDPRPATSLTRANILLSNSTGPDTFATMFFCLLNAADHYFTYANAGHDHPFRVRPGSSLTRLAEGGIPLGVLDDFTYEEHLVDLQPGDMIVVCSDGIAEAFNENGEMFSDARIGQLLADEGSNSSKQMLDHIIQGVKSFVGNTPQSDDMTIVVIKREEKKGEAAL